MAHHNFGFSRPNDDDDDRDGRRDDHGDRDERDGDGNATPPFSVFGFGMPGGGFGMPGGGFAAGGNLGDVLSQFGQMFSGMSGSTGGTQQGSSSAPVDFEMAKKLTEQKLGDDSAPSSSQRDAVADSVKLVDVWIDDATVLPAAGTAAALSGAEWAGEALPILRRLIEPVASHAESAQLDALPEQARGMLGPMMEIMNSMGRSGRSIELGENLANLAQQVLSGSDMGVPVGRKGRVSIVVEHVEKVARQLGLPEQEVLVYACAREAARQRLVTHVGWLVEQLVSSVEEYAAGLTIDTSGIEEATRELHFDPSDPASMQDAMSRIHGMDLEPKTISTNTAAAHRLVALLSLIEGWADHVTDEALSERIPSTKTLRDAWARRASTGGSAAAVMESIVGITIDEPNVAAAAELWRRTTNAVGLQRRDKVWDHPDFLPTLEEITHPAAFIDRLLDDADSGDFDPIAEINALEEQLAREAEHADTAHTDDSPAETDPTAGDTPDSGAAPAEDDAPDEGGSQAPENPPAS